MEPVAAISYLIERRHKRELRRESARGATAIAISQLADEERTLLFGLRAAFVQVLEQKAVLGVAQESMAYYDRVLGVSRSQQQYVPSQPMPPYAATVAPQKQVQHG